MQQGFKPIAGDEFVFEQTVNCLLLPAACGVPTWKSDYIGEREAMKLPQQFRDLFAESRPLDEDSGRKLAEWAKGGAARKMLAEAPAPVEEDFGGEESYSYSDKVNDLDEQMAAAAEKGKAALDAFAKTIPEEFAEPLRAAYRRRHKPRAIEVDRERAAA